ncbi:MAG: rRNA maturation RNase YbeY [Halanaerobiales bacterium]|jgi:probable rRNA maturation factor|nr:rRNA maturation RNase YbeY [Bacillota bacterium]HOA40832.1 rRNA maturation RNase YbeY [Halanaerobiales bacterium]HPZ62941.1 rRNA maturation RNase YbeY [Halanaerobiales bacterium]HQD04154.1 rRNA maturation RNase YbeY [Halanaerobiales bacterium]
MIKIAINNMQDVLDFNEDLEKLLQDIADITAVMEGYKEGEISFALVDNEQIQELNKEYRGIDEPTDVLSFPMDEEIWGDIIISTEKVLSQAEEYGHSLERELGFLAVHGILHLLGYDHQSAEEEAVMRLKEEKVLNKLKLSRER